MTCWVSRKDARASSDPGVGFGRRPFNMERSSLATIEEIAHHEAGHAVVALGYERKIRGIWINEHGGHTDYDHPVLAKYDSWPSRLSAEETHELLLEPVIIFAGICAERHYANDPHRPMLDSDAEDIEIFRAHVDLSEGEKDQLLAQSQVRAGELIKDNWGHVERLAAELLEKRRLSGEEVAALFA
jgi:hypothetical protein